jgi:hypothetical protein
MALVRRFLRILLNAATVLSLLLCAAAVALWVRSYGRVDQFAWKGEAACRVVRSEGGRVAWDNYVITRDYERYALREARVDWDLGYRSNPTGWDRGRSPARRYPQGTDISSFSDWCGVTWTRGVWSFVYPGDFPELTPRGAAWYALDVPHGLLALLFGLFPAYVLTSGTARRLRARARERSALCPAGGYDLRATPDRCPECGATPPPPPAAQQPATPAAQRT